jgi:hypothetical protein
MGGPGSAGSVLAIFELVPPGLMTLLEARDASAVLRLEAAALAEHVLPIYQRKHPDDDRLLKVINVVKLFAVGHATRAQVEETMSSIEQKQKELDDFRRATYTEADWGMFSEGAEELAVTTAMCAATISQAHMADKDVPWFAAHFAAYHARCAAARAAEMTPEYEAYVGESLAGCGKTRSFPLGGI